MNSLRRIPRQTPQCLRQFTTSSQRPQGSYASFLEEALDPSKQPDEAPPPPRSSASALSSLLAGTRSNQSTSRASRLFSGPTTTASTHLNTMKELQTAGNERPMLQQAPRHWKEGNVYAPHDLSIGEAKKWKKINRRPEHDVFDLLGKNPMAFYKNLPLLQEFTTETGRIRAGKETGLRLRNQRRVARAVRRAVGIGLMPSVYAHPELQADKLKIQGYRQQRDPPPGT